LVLLYAHLTEFDAIYHMIENLLRVHRGERYTSDPFQDLYSAGETSRGMPGDRPRQRELSLG
jgi:hypothetical protein